MGRKTFDGTVVECATRWKTTATTAFRVAGEIMADWVLTVDVDRADDDAPKKAGERASFLIHSPTQTLLTPAEEAVGARFAFEIERTEVKEGTRWSGLRGRPVA